jgi:hypothetical protein
LTLELSPDQHLLFHSLLDENSQIGLWDNHVATLLTVDQDVVFSIDQRRYDHVNLLLDSKKGVLIAKLKETSMSMHVPANLDRSIALLISGVRGKRQ